LTNGYLRELGSGAGPELWDNMSRRAIIITFIENCKRNAQMWNEIKAKDLFKNIKQEKMRSFDSTVLHISF
jgi:hypothetical protein